MSQIEVTILGQTYKLVCKEEEQAALMQAAAYVDEKMRAFRDATKIKSTEKIAVMTALSIAAELSSIKAPDGTLSEQSLADINAKVQNLNKVLDEVLIEKTQGALL
jgi:cell division protein ZapA